MSLESVAEAALVNIINDVTTAKSFIISEIPDVLSQLIIWKTYQHLFFVVLSLILSLIIIPYCIYWLKTYIFFDRSNPTEKQKKVLQTVYYEKQLRDSYVAVALALVCCSIGFSVALLCNTMDLLQITVAPKVYLIEYSQQLMSAKK